MLKLIVVCVLMGAPGCGRIGFDAVGMDGLGDGRPADDASGVVDGMDGFGDAPGVASCASLPATCGSMGNAPCCESLLVPGGTFYRSYDVAGDGVYPDMGNPATVGAFRLDQYEVTVGRFRRFVEAGLGTQARPPAVGQGGRTLNGMTGQGGWEASFNGSLLVDTPALLAAVQCEAQYQTWTEMPGGNENRPINCITWYEAMAFCVWDGGFLPTEAEWNLAAAGGSEQRAYPWSSPPSSLTIDGAYASYYDGADCVGDGMPGCALTDLVPVGTKPRGEGLYGQSELGGNVWEWLLDWSASYVNPCDDCANLVPATYRVLRGGALYRDAELLRVAYRYVAMPMSRTGGLGVRCGRSP